MFEKLRKDLLDFDKDIWEVIDYYKDGNNLDELFELLNNNYDPKYEYIRNRVLYILDELPNSTFVDWKKVLPHINKTGFKGDYASLSSSSVYALNIVWNRISNDSYLEKSQCINNIDYYDEAVIEILFVYLYFELKLDEKFFKNLLPIYIQEKYSCEHGVGLSLFLNDKVYCPSLLKNLINYGDPIIEFYASLYITLYGLENNELVELLPSYDIKGIQLKDLKNYEFSTENFKFKKI
jgi:hypothetical protein